MTQATNTKPETISLTLSVADFECLGTLLGWLLCYESTSVAWVDRAYRAVADASTDWNAS